MLKTTILCKHDIDISKDTKLLTFLKQKSVGFVSKKSTVFTSAEIQKFMVDAPDDNYLATKVYNSSYLYNRIIICAFKKKKNYL